MIIIGSEIARANGTAKGLVEARDGERLIHSDRFDLTSAFSRTRFAKAVAGKLDSPDAASEVEKLLLVELERARSEPQPESRLGPAGPDATALLEATPRADRADAEAMLEDPYLIKLVMDDAERNGIAGERALAATLYLVGVSRLGSRPQGAIVQGHTSSGKSFVLEKVATMFPPEAVITAQQMTPQALFHMPPGSLSHRWIVAGERSRRDDDDSAEATRALREMLSSGRLCKLIPTKDEHGGIVTQKVEQDGPIAFAETTTQTKIFDEDANRCLLLQTDEREEQTRRIITAMADSKAGSVSDTSDVLRRHHAAQRILAIEYAPVMIPFAQQLGSLFPAQRPESRRAFGHVLTAIEACAILHLRQRERSSDGRIIAAPDDYTIIRQLLSGPLSRSIGGAISDGAARFRERLLTWVNGRFSSSDCYHRENFSDRCIRGWLAELYQAGLVTLLDSGRGKPTIWELSNTDPQCESPLPPVDVVCGGAGGASTLPTEVNQ